MDSHTTAGRVTVIYKVAMPWSSCSLLHVADGDLTTQMCNLWRIKPVYVLGLVQSWLFHWEWWLQVFYFRKCGGWHYVPSEVRACPWLSRATPLGMTGLCLSEGTSWWEQCFVSTVLEEVTYIDLCWFIEWNDLLFGTNMRIGASESPLHFKVWGHNILESSSASAPHISTC